VSFWNYELHNALQEKDTFNPRTVERLRWLQGLTDEERERILDCALVHTGADVTDDLTRAWYRGQFFWGYFLCEGYVLSQTVPSDEQRDLITQESAVQPQLSLAKQKVETAVFSTTEIPFTVAQWHRESLSRAQMYGVYWCRRGCRQRFPNVETREQHEKKQHTQREE
jgi:hypothetical protein